MNILDMPTEQYAAILRMENALRMLELNISLMAKGHEPDFLRMLTMVRGCQKDLNKLREEK